MIDNYNVKSVKSYLNNKKEGYFKVKKNILF